MVRTLSLYQDTHAAVALVASLPPRGARAQIPSRACGPNRRAGGAPDQHTTAVPLTDTISMPLFCPSTS